jgi:2-methylcitrate dehydratase PrpD
LRNAHRLTADAIQAIELKVHPLVIELTGKRTPKTGLEGKFSVYHAAAIAIIDGRASPNQFSDKAVCDATTIRLRDSVVVNIDPAMPKDAAHVTVLLKDGRQFKKVVEHAIGSVKRPMTDQDLDAKFDNLVVPILRDNRAANLRQACWALEQTPDVSQIARLATVS